jgi:hypothetical protein
VVGGTVSERQPPLTPPYQGGGIISMPIGEPKDHGIHAQDNTFRFFHAFSVFSALTPAKRSGNPSLTPNGQRCMVFARDEPENEEAERT